MNDDVKRLIGLGDGWEGSEALVTLAAADAALLRSAGCPVNDPNGRSSAHTVKGHDLFVYARRLYQQAVAPAAPAAPVPAAGQPATDDGQDDAVLTLMTVKDLTGLAEAEGIDLPSGLKKDQVVERIKAARAARRGD